MFSICQRKFFVHKTVCSNRFTHSTVFILLPSVSTGEEMTFVFSVTSNAIDFLCQQVGVENNISAVEGGNIMSDMPFLCFLMIQRNI